MPVCAVTHTSRPNHSFVIAMHRLLLIAPLIVTASCISFPKAEKMRREGKDLTPKFNPWKTHSESDRHPGAEPQAEDAPAVKARKNFHDPYFRQS